MRGLESLPGRDKAILEVNGVVLAYGMGIIKSDQIDEGRRGPKQRDELRGLSQLTKG